MKMSALFLVGIFSFLAGCAPVSLETPFASLNTSDRYGSIEVEAGSADKPVTMRVFYSQPRQMRPDTPVVFVMHGGRRDANIYRDIWGRYATQYDVLIVSPEIPEKEFPTGWGYQTGNWVTRDSSSLDASKGKRIPPQQSSFAAVERVFDQLRQEFGLEAERYDIYGHGGGAQFVHRMVMLWPDARIRTAIAANAGNYTFPDYSLPLRYGLKNTGIDDESLKRSYAHRLVIMLGTDDNDPHHRILNRTAVAMAQGPHRLARGKSFYAVSKAKAEEIGAEFNWEVETVYGVGHNARGMAPSGARLLLSGARETSLFSNSGARRDAAGAEDESGESKTPFRGADDDEDYPF